MPPATDRRLCSGIDQPISPSKNRAHYCSTFLLTAQAFALDLHDPCTTTSSPGLTPERRRIRRPNRAATCTGRGANTLGEVIRGFFVGVTDVPVRNGRRAGNARKKPIYRALSTEIWPGHWESRIAEVSGASSRPASTDESGAEIRCVCGRRSRDVGLMRLMNSLFDATTITKIQNAFLAS